MIAAFCDNHVIGVVSLPRKYIINNGLHISTEDIVMDVREFCPLFIIVRTIEDPATRSTTVVRDRIRDAVLIDTNSVIVVVL